MKILKSQSGVISLFVIISMLFLLIFIFSIYQVVIDKKNEQEIKNLELREIYSKNFDEIENYLYADENDIIPIYNINELNVVGTGEFILIKNKIYRCRSASSYRLRNNIIVDIKETMQSSRLEFNDYKLYSNNFFIDKDMYDLYYYYKYEQQELWKNIAYQKFSKDSKEIVKSDIFLENKFSIINSFNYHNRNKLYFMMIWKDDEKDTFNLKIEPQEFISKKINSINDINIFNKYYNEINREDGEFYIFVNIENNI